jgi:hypothetical protein
MHAVRVAPQALRVAVHAVRVAPQTLRVAPQTLRVAVQALQAQRGWQRGHQTASRSSIAGPRFALLISVPQRRQGRPARP